MAIELFPSSTPPTPPPQPPPSPTVVDNLITSTSSNSGGSLPQTPSRGISPRISFSHDLTQCDVVPVEPHLPIHPSSLFASANFNFYYPNNPPPPPGGDHLFNTSSSADELFSNGVIIPLNITRSKNNQRQTATARPVLNKSKSKSKSQSTSSNHHQPVITDTDTNIMAETERNEKHQSQQQEQQQNSTTTKSPFWKFKRSRSFNCGRIYSGTLCPLPLLSRSKSTGSNSSSKRSLVPPPKEEHQLQTSTSRNHKQRNPNSGHNRHYSKPPLKKINGYGTGGQSSSSNSIVSPVLNVPSGNLFGIGSFFCSASKGSVGCGKKKVGGGDLIN